MRAINQTAASRGLATWGVLAIAWAACLVGSLQLHRSAGWLTNSLCGPWGCAAAPEALLGYHLFLTLLIVPLALSLQHWLSPLYRRPAAWLLLFSGIALAASIAVPAAWHWRQQDSSDKQRGYTAHRAVFVVVTTPDLPALPITLAGLATIAASAVSSPRRTPGGLPARSDVAAAGTPETP